METNRFIDLLGERRTISIDTRTLKEGDIFFALKGQNFDGNKYVPQALEQGASFVISDNIKWSSNHKVIVVKDVLSFMQRAARAYRDSLSCKVLAITGSNGKTTTKELCHAVVNKAYN